MAVISMKQLLEAGVHFGHQTRRWNPKMKKYIFTERNGIYIIDLQKTVKLVDAAYEYMKEIAEDGGIALFVGTKKQANSFYQLASPYQPTFYWLDAEEGILGGLNDGTSARIALEAMRSQLENDGASKIGVYISNHLYNELNIDTAKFGAMWIPTYGLANGYFNEYYLPTATNRYALHQYTGNGRLNGYSGDLDLNRLSGQVEFNYLFG